VERRLRITLRIRGALHGRVKETGVTMSRRKTARAISLALVLTMTTAAKAQPAMSDGERFLAMNAHALGVTTLPSGLQYKVVQSGPPGPSPQIGDIIQVDYEGRLLSGAVFDSTFARGKPAVMQLAHLVPAWLEALPRMHVGDEWEIYAPPDLGYGDEATGPIPPNSMLIFRIKLLAIGAVN
jgi:peptidylprolyl isomerase/FKBP-type peptidyl-prolyl cis-trans isomerase FklB